MGVYAELALLVFNEFHDGHAGIRFKVGNNTENLLGSGVFGDDQSVAFPDKSVADQEIDLIRNASFGHGIAH